MEKIFLLCSAALYVLALVCFDSLLLSSLSFVLVCLAMIANAVILDRE